MDNTGSDKQARPRFGGSSTGAARVLLILASLIIIMAGVKAAAPILVPFLLAVFIAIICAPPMFWLTARKVPDWAAVSIVALAVFGFAFLMGAFIGSSVDQFSAKLPEYEARLREEFRALVVWLAGFGIDLDAQSILDTFDPSAAMKLAGTTLTGFGNVLANGFLIMMTVVFILFEANSLPKRLVASTHDPEKSIKPLQSISKSVQSYLEIKALVSLMTGGTITLILSILGVDFALIWGLLAFMLNFVPNIGSIIAAVPAVMISFVQIGPLTAAGVGIAYVVVNTVFGNVVEPRLMGKRLGLSTLVVFLSLVFWGWLLGPVGMLLSVPLTIVIKIVLDESHSTRWLAALLGPEDPEPKK